MNVARDRVESRHRSTTFVPTTSSAVMVGARSGLLAPAAVGLADGGPVKRPCDGGTDATPVNALDGAASPGGSADPPNRPDAQAALTPIRPPRTTASTLFSRIRPRRDGRSTSSSSYRNSGSGSTG